MINTKRIKNGTIVTVKYLDGEIVKMEYDSSNKNLKGYSTDDFKFNTIQDIINEFGLYTKGWYRIIDQYAIQEPQFKY